MENKIKDGDYTLPTQLQRVAKWIGAIPAFGDSIGTETSKAQLGCATRIIIDAIEGINGRDWEISFLKESLSAAHKENAFLASELEKAREEIERLTFRDEENSKLIAMFDRAKNFEWLKRNGFPVRNAPAPANR